MTLAEITRILDEMADLEILYLNLTGGDIFMRGDFFEIYDHARRKGFLLMLYTNGTLFTRAIVDRLKQAPPFSIDISVHSVDETAFDRFTQVPGSFRQFMKGMELLRRSGLPFCFKTKAMNWNAAEIPRIRRFVESFGQSFRFTTSLSPRLDGDLSSLRYRSPEEIRVLDDQEEDRADEEEPCADRRDWTSSSGVLPLRLCTNSIHQRLGRAGHCTMQYEHRASLRESPEGCHRQGLREVRATVYDRFSVRVCTIYAFATRAQATPAGRPATPKRPFPTIATWLWTAPNGRCSVTSSIPWRPPGVKETDHAGEESLQRPAARPGEAQPRAGDPVGLHRDGHVGDGRQRDELSPAEPLQEGYYCRGFGCSAFVRDRI
jgi:pyruvate-formate lyase-activating enzyme